MPPSTVECQFSPPTSPHAVRFTIPRTVFILVIYIQRTALNRKSIKSLQYCTVIYQTLTNDVAKFLVSSLQLSGWLTVTEQNLWSVPQSKLCCSLYSSSTSVLFSIHPCPLEAYFQEFYLIFFRFGCLVRASLRMHTLTERTTTSL